MDSEFQIPHPPRRSSSSNCRPSRRGFLPNPSVPSSEAIMQGLDLDTYQLYQQLMHVDVHTGSGRGAQEAALFQSPPPQAPMLGVGGDGQWVADPAGYVAADGFSVLPQPVQIPVGGMWARNGDVFVPGGGDWAGSGGVVPGQGEVWAAGAEAVDGSLMLGGDAFLGNDQLVGVFGVQDLLRGGVDLSEFMNDEVAVNSLWLPDIMNSQAANQTAAHPPMYAPPMVLPAAETNQPASDSSCPSTQAGAADSPGMTPQMPAYPPAVDYQQTPQAASANIPQAMPDDEEAEVAQMVRVAEQCGDDTVSTVWSEEENQLLRDGLSRFADQDDVIKCFSIASGLAKKTVLDVAYRIRWLSDLEKKRAAKQTQIDQAKSEGGMFTKGKGTKGATRKNNKYPLSKDVLNSKSAKELIRDNDRLMDKIEEILKTGQVKNSSEYFYYVKMNMDALLNKVTGMATVMEGLSVDDEEWDDVLKDLSSSAGKDTATPP